MKTFIKLLMTVFTILTLAILFYQSDFEYKNKFLNGESNAQAYKVNISLEGYNEPIYEMLEEALIKYKGNLFLNYYDTQEEVYYKYIYLTSRDYFKDIVLEEGRYISLDEMCQDVMLSTEMEEQANKVGTLRDYGHNDKLVIKTLHSMLADGRYISGNMILQFEKEENFRAFISELNENNIIIFLF